MNKYYMKLTFSVLTFIVALINAAAEEPPLHVLVSQEGGGVEVKIFPEQLVAKSNHMRGLFADYKARGIQIEQRKPDNALIVDVDVCDWDSLQLFTKLLQLDTEVAIENYLAMANLAAVAHVSGLLGMYHIDVAIQKYVEQQPKKIKLLNDGSDSNTEENRLKFGHFDILVPGTLRTFTIRRYVNHMVENKIEMVAGVGDTNKDLLRVIKQAWGISAEKSSRLYIDSYPFHDFFRADMQEKCLMEMPILNSVHTDLVFEPDYIPKPLYYLNSNGTQWCP